MMKSVFMFSCVGCSFILFSFVIFQVRVKTDFTDGLWSELIPLGEWKQMLIEKY